MATGLSLYAFSNNPLCDVSRKCNYLDAETSIRERNGRGSEKKSRYLPGALAEGEYTFLVQPEAGSGELKTRRALCGES
jgi:hypothetical protein